jgi:hypothetical protein
VMTTPQSYTQTGQRIVPVPVEIGAAGAIG